MVQHDKVTQFFMNLLMIILTLCCVLPFVLMVSASFTSETALIKDGYQFWPAEFSLETYQFLWRSINTIGKGYIMTIVVTLIGTTANIMMTVLFAYPLSRKDLPFRGALSFILFFTMLFNGGLVPTYMMYVNTLHLKNTIWGLIIPGLMMNAFYVIMMRSFFTASIPDSLIEAAKLDGASEMKVLTSVILPLSKPMMATLMLMVGLNYWNDWQNGMYYITDQNLFTIQNILNNMISNIEFLSKNASLFGADAAKIQVPTIGIRMGIAVVAIIPVMVIYPFLQKYFVKGIVIGGVKG